MLPAVDNTRGITTALHACMKTLADEDLTAVTGAGAWDRVDNGISKVSPSWKSKSCPSRGAWVGWGLGTALGAASWATWSYTGPVGQAVLGPINGLIGTAAVASYMDNCERQRSGGSK